jgi:hypothetical protein
MYQTSGLKSMVDAAKARADEDEAVRTEALGHIKSSDWGSAAELLLKHIGKRAISAPGLAGPGLEAASGIAQNTYQHSKAAVQAARSGQPGEAVVQAAEAVPVVGSVAEQIGEPLGADLRNKNWSGAAGDVVSGGIQAALALTGGEAAEGDQARTVMSAEESAAKALPLKEAGQQIQSEAKAVRSAKGAELGPAKEALKKTLPEGQMPYPDSGQAAAIGKKVFDEIGSTKLGLKDPDMAEVESLAKQFRDAKTADGKPLSYNMEEAEAEKRALNAKIDALQTKVLQGANGSALRHLKNLRAGFTDDLYDMYEQHGDAVAAQSVRDLGREYAKIVDDQTSGPARTMLKNASPEKIVSTIVSNAAKSQSAVESLMRNMAEAITRARKADSRVRHQEEAPSELFWPGANFDQATLGGPATPKTLGQSLDEYDSASLSKRKTLESGIFQQIIRFRSKLAKEMEDDERQTLERRIAAYSNSLVKRR